MSLSPLCFPFAETLLDDSHALRAAPGRARGARRRHRGSGGGKDCEASSSVCRRPLPLLASLRDPQRAARGDGAPARRPGTWHHRMARRRLQGARAAYPPAGRRGARVLSSARWRTRDRGVCTCFTGATARRLGSGNAQRSMRAWGISGSHSRRRARQPASSRDESAAGSSGTLRAAPRRPTWRRRAVPLKTS